MRITRDKFFVAYIITYVIVHGDTGNAKEI